MKEPVHMLKSPINEKYGLELVSYNKDKFDFDSWKSKWTVDPDLYEYYVGARAQRESPTIMNPEKQDRAVIFALCPAEIK
jgi:hypothetical protein